MAMRRAELFYFLLSRMPMITTYTEQKKQQQRAVLTKLLEVLDELDTDYLYTDNTVHLYYSEEDREHINQKQAQKAQMFIENLRTLKHLRRAERLIPFTHNQ